jgi:hypothetical protein
MWSGAHGPDMRLDRRETLQISANLTGPHSGTMCTSDCDDSFLRTPFRLLHFGRIARNGPVARQTGDARGVHFPRPLATMSARSRGFVCR